MKVNEAINWAAELLNKQYIPNTRLDAEVLLAFVLGMSRDRLYLYFDKVLSQDQIDQFKNLVNRRGRKEPVSYLTGIKEFMSLEFHVNQDVLIPRPDTEVLVERALTFKPVTAIDVGTGSAAIIISLGKYCSSLERGWGIDISERALEVATRNASKHGESQKITFFKGDLLEPAIVAGVKGVDLITANLPYIPSGDIEGLPPDVKLFEPLNALDGGDDGLGIYRKLIDQAADVLGTGGHLLMEIGYNQADLLKEYLFGKGNFTGVEVLKDLAGLDRVVLAKLI